MQNELRDSRRTFGKNRILFPSGQWPGDLLTLGETQKCHPPVEGQACCELSPHVEELGTWSMPLWGQLHESSFYPAKPWVASIWMTC